MPSTVTVIKWLGNDEYLEFLNQYARARELQADAIFDEVLDIADTQQLGITTTIRDDGSSETKEGDMIAHRKLRIDARKWMAAKLAPKKYGEAITTTHTGRVELVQEMIVDPHG